MHDSGSNEHGRVHVTQQEVWQPETAIGCVNSIYADFALRCADVQEIVAPVPVFVSELEAMVSFKPA